MDRFYPNIGWLALHLQDFALAFKQCVLRRLDYWYAVFDTFAHAVLMKGKIQICNDKRVLVRLKCSLERKRTSGLVIKCGKRIFNAFLYRNTENQRKWSGEIYSGEYLFYQVSHCWKKIYKRWDRLRVRIVKSSLIWGQYTFYRARIVPRRLARKSLSDGHLCFQIATSLTPYRTILKMNCWRTTF